MYSSIHSKAHVPSILPLGQSSQYSLNRRLICPHERSESTGEQINLFSYSEDETNFFELPVPRLIAAMTEQSHHYLYVCFVFVTKL
jgi:hypothetical protein